MTSSLMTHSNTGWTTIRQETRVVLFLDIEREFDSIFLKALNKICLSLFSFDDHVKTIVEKVNAS